MTPALLATLALAIAGDRRTANELRNRLGVVRADLPPWPRWLRHALHGASPEAVFFAFDYVIGLRGYWAQEWREQLESELREMGTTLPALLQGWMEGRSWYGDRTWDSLQEAHPPDLYGPVLVGLSVAIDRLLRAGQPGVPVQATWAPIKRGYTPRRALLIVAEAPEPGPASLRAVAALFPRRLSTADARRITSTAAWVLTAARRLPFTSDVALEEHHAIPLAEGRWDGPWEVLKRPGPHQHILAARRLFAPEREGQRGWSALIEVVKSPWSGGVGAEARTVVDGQVYKTFVVRHSFAPRTVEEVMAEVDRLIALHQFRPDAPLVGLQGLGPDLLESVRELSIGFFPDGTSDPSRPELDPYVQSTEATRVTCLPLSSWDLLRFRLQNTAWTSHGVGRVPLSTRPPPEVFLAMAMEQMWWERTSVLDFLASDEGRAFLQTSPSTFAMQEAAESWHRRLAAAAGRERRERQKALALARAEGGGPAPLFSVETGVGPVLVYELAPEELAEEGSTMGHCVGSSPVYKRGVAKGTKRILSVRLPPGVDPGVPLLRAADPAGDRIFTLEIARAQLQQVKGPYDVVPVRQAGMNLAEAHTEPDEEKHERMMAQEQALRHAVAMAVVDALRAREDVSGPLPPDLRL